MFYFYLINLLLLVSQNKIGFLKKKNKNKNKGRQFFSYALGHCFTLDLAHKMS